MLSLCRMIWLILDKTVGILPSATYKKDWFYQYDDNIPIKFTAFVYHVQSRFTNYEETVVIYCRNKSVYNRIMECLSDYLGDLYIYTPMGRV